LFVIGFGGLAFMIAKKMPEARRAQIAGDDKFAGFFYSFKKTISDRIKKNPRFKDFSWLDVAQKLLLKGRVVALKAENKINEYIMKLRQRAENQQNKDAAMLDNYWHDLKSMVKAKKNFNAVTIEPRDAEIARENTSASDEDLVARQSIESAAPAVKTAFPEQLTARSSRQKKRHQRKKKVNDPFRW